MAVRHSPVDAYGAYQILHVSAKTTTTQAVGALVDTTATTVIAGAGVATVTPGSIANMVVGMRLAVADGTGTAEIVTITAIDAVNLTFTATFVNAHSGTYNLRSLRGTFLGPVVFGGLGSTVVLTLYNGHPAVGGQTLAVITPASAPFPFAAACDQGLFYAYTGTTAGDVSIHYQAMPF